MTTNNTKYVSITIIGNPGTGKSTLAKWVSNKLQAHFIEADSLFEVNPFFQMAVQDRVRWSLASDIWFLQERIKLYSEQVKLLETNNIIIDSGLPMSYVYAHSRLQSGFFTLDEWNLYQSLYRTLTAGIRKPDIIINLQLPIKLQRQSIIERGRQFEIVHHTEEYLQSLQNSLDEVVKLAKEYGITVIELDARGQVLNKELLAHLEKYIK